MALIGSVNENSRYPLTWRLFDGDNNPIVPATLRYRIDCESTGRELQGWTDITPAPVTSLVVPSTVNAIQNRANSAELKTLTVEADTGTPNAFTEEGTWRVRNLYGVT